MNFIKRSILELDAPSLEKKESQCVIKEDASSSSCLPPVCRQNLIYENFSLTGSEQGTGWIHFKFYVVSSSFSTTEIMS